jgi:hypothetical protein
VTQARANAFESEVRKVHATPDMTDLSNFPGKRHGKNFS